MKWNQGYPQSSGLYRIRLTSNDVTVTQWAHYDHLDRWALLGKIPLWIYVDGKLRERVEWVALPPKPGQNPYTTQNKCVISRKRIPQPDLFNQKTPNPIMALFKRILKWN
jgi:hypothetical protein